MSGHLHVIIFPGSEGLAAGFTGFNFTAANFEHRRFPDHEAYVRFAGGATGKAFVLVCSLDRADEKFLPLHFLTRLLRDKGAQSVGLVAPYLGYMRQDKEFHPGEAITSRYFAELLAQSFDWLVTLDPHLHRYKSLEEIYQIPCRVVHATPAIVRWIRSNIHRPLILGPDEESAQWVEAVAREVGGPFAVATKVRSGDRSVTVLLPDLSRWPDHDVVLLDDIVSSARTMIEAVAGLTRTEKRSPTCIGVHPIFAGDGYSTLVAAKPARIVTCNTIGHETNHIDVSGLLAAACSEFLPRHL